MPNLFLFVTNCLIHSGVHTKFIVFKINHTTCEGVASVFISSLFAHVVTYSPPSLVWFRTCVSFYLTLNDSQYPRVAICRARGSTRSPRQIWLRLLHHPVSCNLFEIMGLALVTLKKPPLLAISVYYIGLPVTERQKGRYCKWGKWWRERRCKCIQPWFGTSHNYILKKDIFLNVRQFCGSSFWIGL